MDANEQNYIVRLLGNCQSHEDWLGVMRFGMPTLLANQRFLMELIVRQAQKMAEIHSEEGTADHARVILAELGLSFVASA